MQKIDNLLNKIQLYSYKFCGIKFGNKLQDFRSRFTMKKGDAS